MCGMKEICTYMDNGRKILELDGNGGIGRKRIDVVMLGECSVKEVE